MKKCPECGNPSYDGAPVCGNCGYNFPKPKSAAPIRKDIFLQEPELKEKTDKEDTLTIIKENKVIIGIILFITLIVICGIILTGDDSNSNLSFSNDLLEYSSNAFTFSYPKEWTIVNGSDIEHPGAIFYQNNNNVTIEFYNITTEATSLKEITKDIINYAQNNGAYVELVETITLDGRNSSNIILENNNGDYTRFVSMFSQGELYVFKITGSSPTSIISDDINTTINSADIA